MTTDRANPIEAPSPAVGQPRRGHPPGARPRPSVLLRSPVGAAAEACGYTGAARAIYRGPRCRNTVLKHRCRARLRAQCPGCDGTLDRPSPLATRRLGSVDESAGDGRRSTRTGACLVQTEDA
jgi:hypothetical protein